MVQDGPDDEVGEEGDEEEIGEEVLALGLALREIDEVGDLGDGEEGDAEREQDGVRIEVGEVEGLDEEEGLIEVLEVEEAEEVEGYAEGEQALSGGGVFGRGGDSGGDEVVDEDGADQVEDEEPAGGGIEDERHAGQPGDDRTAAVSAEQVEAHQGDRQKFEEVR